MNAPQFALAAVMTAPNEPLDVRSYPVPEPPAGGLLARVLACTICGSDLHSWRGRRPTPLPMILGHEVSGRVEALGEGVSCDAAGAPLRVGDRVVWTLHESCGACRYCGELALPMKCRTLRKFGHERCDRSPHLVGGLAELCVVGPGAAVLRAPESIADATLAPVGCAAATAIEACRVAGLAAGERVLILGAGALGAYAAAFARSIGCAEVVVAALSPPRLALAERLGATATIEAHRAEDAAAFRHRVLGLVGPEGADCVLSFAGSAAAVAPGLASLRVGGRLVEAGCVFPGAVAPLDVSLLVRNRLTIAGVHNYALASLAEALRLIEAGRFAFHEVVGPAFPLTRVGEALREAERGPWLRVAVTP